MSFESEHKTALLNSRTQTENAKENSPPKFSFSRSLCVALILSFAHQLNRFSRDFESFHMFFFFPLFTTGKRYAD